jgi:gliding motility-associated-like protein
MFSFKRHLLLIVLSLLTTTLLPGQEICNNGIDDDNDGLVDLKDPDCQCRIAAPYNLLQNPSFETYKHCRTNSSYSADYDIAYPWLYAVQPNGDISFYHNLKCPTDSVFFIDNYLPRPIPDGSGIVLMIRGTSVPSYNVPEKDAKKTYLAQCLEKPLQKNVVYTFSFFGAAYLNKYITKFGAETYTVALFGNADCNAIPFGVKNRNNGCPANYPGWIMLGKATFTSPYKWVQAKMELTIPYNINMVAVGQDCSLVDLGDSSAGGDAAAKAYYYLDDLQLAEKIDFNLQYIKIQSGTTCSGKFILQAPVSDDGTYQWYRDSIALVGEKGSVLKVDGVFDGANFNVLITKNGRCKISEPLFLQQSRLDSLKLPADTTLCLGFDLVLKNSLPGVNFLWNGNRQNVITIKETGIYSITASDTFGCSKSFAVKTTFKDCSNCELFAPGAFTPNGDGLNDAFKTHCFCPVSNFHLEIYNRFGQMIFSSDDIQKGWDGTINGKKAPLEAYAYSIKYKVYAADKNYKIKKGTVVVLR